VSWLADTNILSAAALTKARPDEALRAWLAQNADGIFLSAITVFEIEDGIAKLTREGASAKAAALTAWLDVVETAYGARILAVDAAVSRLAGQMSDRVRGAGLAVGYPDLLIAATAAHHGLTVLTRNLRHFAPLGVRAVDPVAG
jgi:predicted nucleic acid-binding protein